MHDINDNNELTMVTFSPILLANTSDPVAIFDFTVSSSTNKGRFLKHIFCH